MDIAEPVVEQKIVINPVQARAYGLTPREITQYISLAFEGQAPAFLRKDGDESEEKENAEIRSENGLYCQSIGYNAECQCSFQ